MQAAARYSHWKWVRLGVIRQPEKSSRNDMRAAPASLRRLLLKLADDFIECLEVGELGTAQEMGELE